MTQAIAEAEATTKVQQSALSLVERGNALVVTNDQQYAEVANFRKEAVKAMLREIDAATDPNIKRWHDGHKQALADKQKLVGPIDMLYKRLGALLVAFDQERERKRREEENRLRELARQQAEKDQLDRAAALERAGNVEEANAVFEAPVAVAPIVLPQAPKVAGLSMRETWKFRVVDASKIKPEFLVPDEVKIGQLVRSMKEAAQAIVGEGIEVYSEKTPVQ